MSERGIKRLSWAAAVLMPLIVFIATAFAEAQVNWGPFAIALVFVGAAAFGIVRLSGWVFAGFKADKEKAEEPQNLDQNHYSGSIH